MNCEQVEEMVRTIVGKRAGHQRGISACELAAQAGCSERMARNVVAHLVEDHGLNIGSHPAFGFFTIESKKDLELATRHLKSRGVKILQRLSKLEKISVPEAAHQLALFQE